MNIMTVPHKHFVSGMFQLHTPESLANRREYPAKFQVVDYRTVGVSGNARQRRLKVRQWKMSGLKVVQYSPQKLQTIVR